jgi:hypothetical protein
VTVNAVVPAPGRRVRGKSKAKNWRRDADAPCAVIRLELDASNAQVRRRVERMYAATFQLRRALQGQARSRVDAYWAAFRLREVDAAAARTRFGLSRASLETAAYRHVEAAGWLRHHVTKAVAMHVADEVWQTCERNLFGDKTGKRSGGRRSARGGTTAASPAEPSRTRNRARGKHSASSEASTRTLRRTRLASPSPRSLNPR